MRGGKVREGETCPSCGKGKLVYVHPLRVACEECGEEFLRDVE